MVPPIPKMDKETGLSLGLALALGGIALGGVAQYVQTKVGLEYVGENVRANKAALELMSARVNEMLIVRERFLYSIESVEKRVMRIEAAMERKSPTVVPKRDE